MDIEVVLRRGRGRRRLPPPEVRRQLRLAAGITQSELAEVLDVSRPEVSRWESGQRSPRHGNNLERYLAVLDRLAREFSV